MRNLRRLTDITAIGGFFDSQVVAQSEAATFLRTEIAPRKRVLGRHRHQVAQLYFVLSGAIDVEVGSADVHADTGSLVIIPPGFSHMARNPGEVAAVMLEAFVPAASPIDPAAELCDRDETAPSVDCLRVWVPSAFEADTARGLGSQWLVPPPADSTSGAPVLAAVSVIRHEPGNPGVELHVHGSDQVHVVLEGTLVADIAGDTLTAGHHDVVLIPAGVPHAFRNGGPGPATHFHLYLPGLPGDDRRWGNPVAFSLR